MKTTEVKQHEAESNSMEATQKAHLAGFLDAIGAIRLQVIKDDGYSIGFTIDTVVRFYRPREDDPILGKMAAYCEENTIKYGTFEHPRNDSDGMSIGFQVTGYKNVPRFLDPLLEHFVTNYYKAMILIEEVAPAMENGNHLEKQGFLELVKLGDEIRNTNREQKYTQEYFEELWSLPE